MNKVIDVAFNCGAAARQIAAAGVQTVIRYYSRDTIRPQKPLARKEADLLSAAGLRLAIVYEGRRGNKLDNFDRPTGLLDGHYARDYAAQIIGQPGNSVIYFAVDLDVAKKAIQDRIIPYFEGLNEALAEIPGRASYRIGVYGSGAVCAALLDKGLAQVAWLAQATGWAGYRDFLASGRWTLKQGMPTRIASIDCDPNDIAPGADIGDFGVGQAPLFELGLLANAAERAGAMRVNARRGLRLRKGPGTDFPSLPSLRFGTIVHPLGKTGEWTLVDLEGDGAADGFVSSEFLSEVAEAPALAPSALPVPPVFAASAALDATQVDELLQLACSAPGLARARAIATREFLRMGFSPYPTNGCAAHLSALLQMSEIDVPMTYGAGSLARILLKRGWSEIAPGAQTAGDVGVTFDRDPTPAGADHIYLVIESIDGDKMMIADNQWTKDEPHVRYASGKGKTETEYFLRAT